MFIKSFIKLFVLTITLVLVLSVTVKDKPLFTHIYNFISPATTSAQKATEGFLKSSLSTTQTYSRKLFDNSVPKMKDSVKSRLSSNKKMEVAEPAERITDSEKAELDDLIKNH